MEISNSKQIPQGLLKPSLKEIVILDTFPVPVITQNWGMMAFGYISARYIMVPKAKGLLALLSTHH